MAAESSSLYSKPRPLSSYNSSIHSSNNTPFRSDSITAAPVSLPRTYGPFITVDPYVASISQSVQNLGYFQYGTIDSSLEDVEVPDPSHSYSHPIYQHSILTVSVGKPDRPENPEYTLSTYITAFTFDTLPRLIYSFTLLRLPSLYFSRVARVFEDAELTMPEIKRMALDLASQHPEDVHRVLFTNLSHHAPVTSPFWNLKSNWESFIESLLREWKTLNIISVLLLSAILTVLQIDVAANDPLTRYSALLSLICALMSLLYGCVFIIRFGGMKKPHKAAEWAWEARRTRTLIWWNVWVMLAMPAVWLAWSVVAYIICIMAFVWRTGSTQDGTILPLEPHLAFWPRLVISLILALGLIYFVLIMATLRRYGSVMDKKWREKVKGWTDRLIYQQPFPEHMGAYPLSHHSHWNTSFQSVGQRKDSDDSYGKPFIPPGRDFYTRSPSPLLPSDNGQTDSGRVNVEPAPKPPGLPAPVQTFKAIELRFQGAESDSLPPDIEARHVSPEVWGHFIADTEKAWNESFLPGRHEMTPQANVLRVISMWNVSVFGRLCIEALLCQEYYPEWPESPAHAIYLVDRQPILGRTMHLEERFGPIPRGLVRIDILDFSNREHRWVTLFPERGTGVRFNTPRSPSRPPSTGQYSDTRFKVEGDNYDNNDDDNDEGERSWEVEQQSDGFDRKSGAEFLSSTSRRPATPPKRSARSPSLEGSED
ncbi:hypothetical protein P691DRAFT_764496 [Macrolepiota fuliginosa MF-IS2]|uniref:Uncharacterized protein n=1 Tax=Macrolepiota fuliginosa MF-IS2 TaxID=1400762 RepID=A0A9P5X2B3_9AGAR|nr:hypothetical protein P691DRAFT_764496 [Macrolepiota fuliginosa MF-IS2]